MEYRHIKFERRAGQAIISLNRPEVLNSFNRLMATEVQNALKASASDGGVRAVLLTGEGRGFCSGQDLADVGDVQRNDLDLGAVVEEVYNPIVTAIRELEKPVVCAVNGVAAGAGANLALCCDLVLASTQASFIQSFVKVGLVPDTGGTFFLPRLIGLSKAMSLMLMGDKIDAATALELGLVYRVFEPAVLMEEALKITDALSHQPTGAIGFMKRAMNASFSNSLAEQLQLEADLQREAGRSQDFREGVAAFLEKRKAVFKGK
jgi:2-(1,2-epoxy-1,2-dihydrophenyl)acetyl-CoA isomerase